MIVVTGATGKLGSAVVANLLKRVAASTICYCKPIKIPLRRSVIICTAANEYSKCITGAAVDE